MDSILGISKTESKCTGCGACVSVCPKGAIRLVERKGYFLFPEIDEAKCTHCGLCLKRCPATIPARGSEEPKNGFPEIYGVYAKDEELRVASSSGGAFSILAEAILAQGGAVCGAAFTSGCKLEHVIIEKREDLDKLRRSKYVQSNPGSIYRQVKSLLDAGRKVLFVGTPCQVAAMKAVAGDQENLLTADFFCHGVPPQKLFEAHVNLITGGRASEVTDIRFRDKRGHGWTPLHMSFKWSAGKYESRCIDDPYFRGFNFNMTIRRSCGNCRFSRIPRPGDFTLGDLWKVAPQELHILDNKGVSALCVNNERAKTVFESVKDRFAVVLPVPLESVHRTNLIKFHSYRHPHAWRFWNWLENGGDVARLHEKIRECLDADDGIAILNFHDSRCNYGSVLAGYALQEKVRELAGFSPVHICLWDGFRHEISDLRDFTKEHIVETKPCVNAQKLRSLNRHFRTFIVGPDVVWRNAGYFGDFYKFMFNFVFFSKNICSYAASFMSPFLTGWSRIQNKTVDLTESEIVERKRLLKRFSHVSVREDFGVEMCRRHFDVAAEQVLDSVFLLPGSHYEKLLGEAEHQFPSRGKAVYMLSPSAVPSDVLQELKRDPTVEFLRQGDDISNVKAGKECVCKGLRVVEWLKAIHDCDLLVTDSFHGMCFALIFRRQFVLIYKDYPNWRHRHESLLRALRLEMRYVRGLEDYRYWQSHPIDYSQVEPRLNELIARSEDYLKRCLADHRRNPTREWLESIEIGQWQQRREMEEKVAQAARRGCLLRRLCGFIRRLGHRTA